jgi:hypothetical protein
MKEITPTPRRPTTTSGGATLRELCAVTRGFGNGSSDRSLYALVLDLAQEFKGSNRPPPPLYRALLRR